MKPLIPNKYIAALLCFIIAFIAMEISISTGIVLFEAFSHTSFYPPPCPAERMLFEGRYIDVQTVCNMPLAAWKAFYLTGGRVILFILFFSLIAKKILIMPAKGMKKKKK